MPAAAPAVLSLSLATQQENSLHHPNDSTRFRKACILTTQKTLRENTCPIDFGDYSTPVLQRMRKIIFIFLIKLHHYINNVYIFYLDILYNELSDYFIDANNLCQLYII